MTKPPKPVTDLVAMRYTDQWGTLFRVARTGSYDPDRFKLGGRWVRRTERIGDVMIESLRKGIKVL